MLHVKRIANWLVAQALVVLVGNLRLPPRREPRLPRRVFWWIVGVSALLGSLSACTTPRGQTEKANPYTGLLKEYSKVQDKPTPLYSPPTDPKKSSTPTAKTLPDAPR